MADSDGDSDSLENMTRIQRSIEFIRRAGVYNGLVQYKNMVENDYSFGVDDEHRKELLLTLYRETEEALAHLNKMRRPFDAPNWQKPMMPQFFRVYHAGFPDVSIPSYPVPIDPDGNPISDLESYHQEGRARLMGSIRTRQL